LTQRQEQKTAPLLTPEQKEFFLHLLSRGASPAGACQQVGVSFTSYARTLATDEDFQTRLKEVEAALSQNVVAALYQTAMKGNVSAQKRWLETSAPPGWKDEISVQNDSDLLDALSDEELIELARAMGVEIPPEIETKIQRSNT